MSNNKTKEKIISALSKTEIYLNEEVEKDIYIDKKNMSQDNEGQNNKKEEDSSKISFDKKTDSSKQTENKISKEESKNKEKLHEDFRTNDKNFSEDLIYSTTDEDHKSYDDNELNEDFDEGFDEELDENEDFDDELDEQVILEEPKQEKNENLNNFQEKKSSGIGSIIIKDDFVQKNHNQKPFEPTKPINVPAESQIKNQNVKNSKDVITSIQSTSTNLNEVDVTVYTHEKFVSVVKSFADPIDKVKLMGKRISFLNSSIDNLWMTNNQLKTKTVENASNFENAKKDLEKEVNLKLNKKLQDFISDFIPSIDIFEMAIENKSDNPELKKWLVGFKMIYNQIYNVLQSNGVKKMEINKGDKPNHNFHNQIELFKTNEIEPGLIYSIKQSGYFFNDKVLRVASVVISAPLDKVEVKDDKKDKTSKEDNY